VARRATYFFDFQSSAPYLLVSGGWEFMDTKGNKPSPQVINGLAKAFDLMKYDIGLLAQGEADGMDKTLLPLDSTRKTARSEPVKVVTTSTGDRIGFIRLPSLPKGEDVPSKKMIQKISLMVKKEQEQVKLLIALSDWGWIAEREYLAQNPTYVPDILMGSGYGSGVSGRIQADKRCFWIRPYDKGRTLCEIEIFNWPDRTTKFEWEAPADIKALSVGLGDQYQDNPDVSAILH